MHAANERAGTAPTVPALDLSRLAGRIVFNPSQEVTMVTHIMPAERPAIPPTSNRERDDDYRAVVVRLNADWRVIECTAGLQWMTQRLLPASERATARWQAKSHCRSRGELIALVARHCGQVGQAATATMLALPTWIGGDA